MKLETGLRLIFITGILIVVATQVLVLQDRHGGQIQTTGRQKILVVMAGGVAVIAGGMALFV